jgi:hypothetical protein
LDDEGQTLFSFNNLTNTWSEIGDLKDKFEKIGSKVRGGARCKRGYNYFFGGFIFS